MTQTLYAHMNKKKERKKERKKPLCSQARQWLTAVIPATQEAESRRIRSSKPAQANSSRDPSQKTLSQKTGLVEWLKVKALNSSSST
jgi:hypothetical protein